jgi:hypothetical protein
VASVYCPVDNKPYATMILLKEHLKKAAAEGDQNHIDIIELEGWEEKIVEVPSENWQGSQIVEEGMN